MRRVWAIAAKDLLETQRDKLAALFTLIMPIAFTLFLGLVIGSGVETYPLVVHDGDGGSQARLLVRQLKESEVVTVKLVGAAEVERNVSDGEAAAGLLIPQGYTQAVTAGQRTRLTVVRSAGSSGAQTVEQQIRTVAASQALQTRAVAAAQEAAAPGDEADPERLRSIVEESVTRSLAAPAVTVRSVQSGSTEGEIPTGFDLTSTGMIVNFVLFSTLSAGVALIMERRSGTLQRLLTTRASRGELIAGKVLGMFILTFVQQVLLVGIGALAFGVGYFNAPLALVLVMLSLSALVSCLGLLLATLFGSEQALVAASVLLSMAWAALSGGWFPLEITGPTFSTIGHILPTAWTLDALRGIIMKGYSLVQVLPAVGYAFAWAAGLFAIGVWRFRSAWR